MANLNRSILEAALIGLESRREQIEQQISTVQGMMRDGTAPRKTASADQPPSTPTSKPGSKKRRLSPAGRRAIAEAARRRWAAVKSEQGATGESAGRKGGLTTAGRKRLADAMRKRWAAKRTAGLAAAKKGVKKKATAAS